MRPVLLGDAVAAARSLLRVPAADRAAHLALIFAEADAADRYRRTFGRTHPWFGDGSLMAVALHHHPAREPSLEDRDYCRCLSAVFSLLAEARDSRPTRASIPDEG